MSEVKIKLPLKIVNIHRGKGYRSQFIYAELRDDDDQLLISALLPPHHGPDSHDPARPRSPRP